MKQTKMETNLEKVGALWQETCEEGRPYFRADILGKKLIAFPNPKWGIEQDGKVPDFEIFAQGGLNPLVHKEAESALIKVGGLYQNTDSEGRPYFNVVLEGQKFVSFPNGWKSEDKEPDFIVYERVRER